MEKNWKGWTGIHIPPCARLVDTLKKLENKEKKRGNGVNVKNGKTGNVSVSVSVSNVSNVSVNVSNVSNVSVNVSNVNGRESKPNRSVTYENAN